jgi:hypothetical protein
MNIKLLVLAIFILAFQKITCQDSISYPEGYSSGISLVYGTGSVSVRDRYISQEVYSGTTPFLSIGWTRRHDRYVYRLTSEYRQSDKIHNYNVSTDITQFSISQGFLYPLKKISLFNKDFFLRMGPGTEIYVFANKPRIAVSGFDYAQSFAGMISLVYSAEVIYLLEKKFHIESSFRFSVLSLGFRSVDSEESDQETVKPLTTFSGLNSSFHLGFNYYLLKPLSLQVAYRFELMRISSWEPLQGISNNIIIGTVYNF